MFSALCASGSAAIRVFARQKSRRPGVGSRTGLPALPQVDKNGRFGFVVPGGVSHIFVKMYGTLWRKVIFDGGTTDTIQTKSWDGTVVNFSLPLELRYGDVNEDNKIVIDDLAATYDRGYLNARLGGEVSMTSTGEFSIFKYDYVCDLNRDNKINAIIASSDTILFDLFEPTAQEANLEGNVLGVAIP